MLFSLSAMKDQRYILPITPAVALLAAYVAREEEAAIERGVLLPGAPTLRRLHWASLTAVSLGCGALFVSQDWLIARDWLSPTAVPSIAWPVGVAASMLLLAIAVVGWRWHETGRPSHAALATAGWALLVLTIQGYTAGDSDTQSIEAEARRVATLVERAPLRYLDLGKRDEQWPNMQFLFYFRRPIPALRAEDVSGYIASSSPVFVLAESQDRYDELMRESGCTVVTELKDGRTNRSLWRHTAERQPLTQTAARQEERTIDPK